MNRIILLYLTLLSTLCYAQQSSCNDYIPVVRTVHELTNSDSKEVILRTNDICFQFVYRHLDTSDYQTRIFLDSIASFLLSNDDIESVEVDVHLSLTEWDESYSVSLLFYMYDEIISFLGNCGVDTTYVKGKQYYNYCPIVNCNELSGEERKNCFVNDDPRLNHRVEFVIKKRE